MLAGILSRTDSDTSKITSAQGLLASIQAILNSLKNEKNELTLEDVISTIKEYQDACTIEYGQNRNKLSQKIEAQIGEIDFEKIRDVIETRLPHGQYYDYKFLKIAAEMTLN